MTIELRWDTIVEGRFFSTNVNMDEIVEIKMLKYVVSDV